MYTHKIDKIKIPTCRIMGVDIAAVDMEWLLRFTDRYIKEMSGDYMCVSNVHTTVTAYENSEYCAIQNGGIMAIPDGGPLALIGQKRGYRNMRRTAGPSYMKAVLKRSAERGWRHYLYGSTEETLETLKKTVERNYPGLQIVGMYSPPFRPMTEEEDQQIIKQINDSCADFIWVGLGAPKQEIWMAAHQGTVRGFMVGVGAAFDYLAGNIKRAPEWMQKRNMEWFYRFVQDPKRLFRRYFYTNSKFIWHAMIKGR